MENLKIKPLTKEQIIVSIDRLTRFKSTRTKYFRVFTDIIIQNLISPKFKKSELEKFDPAALKDYAEKIINYSLEKIFPNGDHIYTVNKRLEKYEKETFNCDAYTSVLLDNKINYYACINLIDDNSPKNLQWLKKLSEKDDIYEERAKSSLHFPINVVVLAEGVTEEILLPRFAQICNFDFDKNGVHVIAAGGKNPLVKTYYELKESLKLPIYVLLDKDGEINAAEIAQKLRPIDKIHLIDCGEFEDLLPLELIERTLNTELKNISPIEKDVFVESEPHAKMLENIFKNRGMHEFKKAEFAKNVKENIENMSDVSAEIQTVINEISSIKLK